MCVVTATAGATMSSILADVSMGMSALGGISSAYGSYQQGKQQRAISEYNARQSEMSARQSMEKGAHDANQKRQDVKSILSKQAAELASNNVELSSGTSLNLAADSAWSGEMDARILQNSGLNQAIKYNNEASISRWQGKDAYRNGVWGAAGSLLGAATSIGGTALNFLGGGGASSGTSAASASSGGGGGGGTMLTQRYSDGWGLKPSTPSGNWSATKGGFDWGLRPTRGNAFTTEYRSSYPATIMT